MSGTAENSSTRVRGRNGSAREALPQALGEQVYDLIKADIVLCQLPPGEEVTEIRLAERYGFGRAPVRTALSKLVQEALVTVVPRRGYVVSPITVKGVQELFDLRLICEPAAVRTAVGHVNLERLRALNSYPTANDSSRQNLRFLKNNHEFHMEILGACGNQRLTRILSGLYDEMDRLINLGLFAERDKSVMKVNHEAQGHQHDAIIAALEQGDTAAAEEMTVSHIESSRDLALKAILNGRLSFSI
jgi:DNA-binding GntR family transcriptional regulator